MKSRDPSYLLDMLVAARRIAAFVDGADLQKLVADDLLQSAVCRQLQILGDAARRLSDHFRAENDQIGWREIIGMRNILVHAYDRVDDEEVWRAATVDVPRLIVELERLVKAE